MNTRWMTIALIASALVLGACEKEKKATTEEPAKTEKEGAMKTPEPPKAKGIENPKNDAKVVELAKAALACEWKNGKPAHNCEAFKAWRKAEPLKKGAADATLVNLLEDADTKVRWLGASALRSHGKAYKEDTVMATVVLEATKAEKDKETGVALGKALAKVSGDKTKLGDAVKGLIKEHPNDDVRSAIVGDFLFHNRTDANYDFVAGIARSDAKDDVRLAASKSFWIGTPSSKTTEVCALWFELATDKNADIAGNSAYHTAFYPHGGGCTAQWDPLLDLLEKESKAGTVKSSFMASSLKYLHKQKKSSDAQKGRAQSIAKELVKNAGNDKTARSGALRFIGETDPKGSKFAKGFIDDKEFFVKSTAKDIVEGKIKYKAPAKK